MNSTLWQPWIEEACRSLGVDPALVDVPLIHELTKQVAHRYERPMAPVSSYILGLALGGEAGTSTPAERAARARELVERLDATLPPDAGDPAGEG